MPIQTEILVHPIFEGGQQQTVFNVIKQICSLLRKRFTPVKKQCFVTGITRTHIEYSGMRGMVHLSVQPVVVRI